MLLHQGQGWWVPMGTLWRSGADRIKNKNKGVVAAFNLSFHLKEYPKSCCHVGASLCDGS